MRLLLRLTVFAVATLIATSCARARRVETSTPAIFREVKLPTRTVVLGTPFGDKARYGTLVADTVLRLHEASFAGAEAIYVHLGAGDTVRGMTYDYGREWDFEKRVADYYRLLGPPIERVRLRGSPPSPLVLDVAPLERVVWEDLRTRFELHLDTTLVPRARVSRAVWLDRR